MRKLGRAERAPVARCTNAMEHFEEILSHRLRFARHAWSWGRDPTLHWLVRLERRFDVSVDVGAHHGLYARALADKSTTVIAIEPNPRATDNLNAVLPKNCMCLQLALSDHCGSVSMTTPLRDGSPDWALTSAEKPRADWQDFHEWAAPCMSLDKLFQDEILVGQLGFIKLDVEGHEDSVIRGAMNTITHHRPILLVEAEARHGLEVAALFDQMSQLQYRAYLPKNKFQIPLTSAEFLDLQVRSIPGTGAYINNVVFAPIENSD